VRYRKPKDRRTRQRRWRDAVQELFGIQADRLAKPGGGQRKLGNARPAPCRVTRTTGGLAASSDHAGSTKVKRLMLYLANPTGVKQGLAWPNRTFPRWTRCCHPRASGATERHQSGRCIHDKRPLPVSGRIVGR
jgi:hypothetical protein